MVEHLPNMHTVRLQLPASKTIKASRKPHDSPASASWVLGLQACTALLVTLIGFLSLAVLNTTPKTCFKSVLSQFPILAASNVTHILVSPAQSLDVDSMLGELLSCSTYNILSHLVIKYLQSAPFSSSLHMPWTIGFF